MKDERLLAFYEAVRQQVILDGYCRSASRENAFRVYEEKLSEELSKRRLNLSGQAHDGNVFKDPV